MSCPIKSDEITPSKTNEKTCLTERKRCSYILIDRTINVNQKSSIDNQIAKLKNAIIERIKSIEQIAQDGDIIEINTSYIELTQPPLIPFCQAKQVLNEENICRIENIQFEKCLENNLLISIDAANRQMRRQLTYYTDLFIFKINSLDFSNENPQNTSAIRRLKGCRTTKTQIFHFSEQINSEKEHFQSIGIDPVYSFDNRTVNSNCNRDHNGIRKEITIQYGHNDPSSNTQISQTKSYSYGDVATVTTHSTIRYLDTQTSTTQSSDQFELRLRSQTIASSQISTRDSSPQEYYRAPYIRKNLFQFKWGFG